MRLIDAEKLKEDIKEIGCDRFESWDKMLTLAEYETFVGDVIDNAPTVRPHGNWNYIQAGMAGCPFCGASPHKDYRNFCPKCGADMREDSEA